MVLIMTCNVRNPPKDNKRPFSLLNYLLDKYKLQPSFPGHLVQFWGGSFQVSGLRPQEYTLIVSSGKTFFTINESLSSVKVTHTVSIFLQDVLTQPKKDRQARIPSLHVKRNYKPSVSKLLAISALPACLPAFLWVLSPRCLPHRTKIFSTRNGSDSCSPRK